MVCVSAMHSADVEMTLFVNDFAALALARAAAKEMERDG